MSYLHINNEAAAIITDLGKNANKTESLVAKLSKHISYLEFKKDTASSVDSFEEVKLAIVASFDKRERGLLAYTKGELRTMNEGMKKDRKKAQQKIGSRCADIRIALEKLQKPKSDSGRKAKTLREWMLAEICDKAEKKIANADSPNIKSVKATVDALKALRATL